MPRLLLLLIIALNACATPTAPTTPTTPAAPTQPSRPLIERDGHTYAVVELVDWCVEASGMGGTHWSFRVDGADHLLHGGGHGQFADDDLPGFTGQTLADVPVQRRYFVAKVSLGTALSRHGLGVWCPERPDYTGDVIALGRANGLADARALLVETARTGVLANPVEIRGSEIRPRDELFLVPRDPLW